MPLGSFPQYPHPSPEGIFVTMINLHRLIIITRVPYYTLEFTFGVVYPMVLDKCIMTFPSLWYHSEYFHCWKNYLYSAYSSGVGEDVGKLEPLYIAGGHVKWTTV